MTGLQNPRLDLLIIRKVQGQHGRRENGVRVVDLTSSHGLPFIGIGKLRGAFYFILDGNEQETLHHVLYNKQVHIYWHFWQNINSSHLNIVVVGAAPLPLLLATSTSFGLGTMPLALLAHSFVHQGVVVDGCRSASLSLHCTVPCTNIVLVHPAGVVAFEFDLDATMRLLIFVHLS